MAENKNWLSKAVSSMHDFGNPDSQFNEIDTALSKLNKKIVVFIDDLDRLNSIEIMELIKLVRNSANFRNTFFIVGFDRNYLQEALSKHTQYGRISFLEKIFQLQIDLSHIPVGLIRDSLKTSLLERLGDYNDAINMLFNEKREPITTISDIFEGKVNSFHFISSILTNLRDIKRFANFFSISIKLVGKEVIFEEYFYVALLKFKYPALISRLKRFRSDYLMSEVPNSSLPYNGIDEAKIKGLCEEDGIERMDVIDQKLVCEILTYVLSGEDKDRRSVIHPDKFDLYFDNSINTQMLLLGEFVPLLDKDWKEIKYQVLQWIEEKKSAYILDILNSIDPYITTHRTDKVCRILVTLINQNENVEASVTAWLKLMGDKSKLHLFGTEGPKNLVYQLFDTSNSTFFYTTSALRSVLKKYIDGKKQYFPLTKEECQKITINRLKEFVDSRNEFDRRVIEAFYYNCWESKDGDRILIMKEANEILLEHINKYPTQYLRFVLRPLWVPMTDGEYTFEPFIPQYFGSWDQFEKFLHKTIESPQISEFESMIEYFNKFKESNYKSFFTDEVPSWIEIDERTQMAKHKHFKNQTYDSFFSEYGR